MKTAVSFLKKYRFLLFCFGTAAIILLFCSKSSPLYPMNDWVDVNCFYTMGKSLLHGKVPYRDLYEQKGPVLYFVYALIALVSPGSFWGVWLLEIVTFGLFLYYSGKILQLYLGEGLFSWLAVPVLAALICVSPAFAHGASVEEMTLFMSVYGFYIALRAFRENRALHFREALTCGVFSGMLLWIKYTMLGTFLGLAIFLIIWYLIWGHGKLLLKTIGAFFAGLGAVTAVVFLYFLFTGALDDLWTVYFYNNIFLYAKEPEVSRFETIRFCLEQTLKRNDTYVWLFLPGLAWALVRAVRDVRPLLLLVLSFCTLVLGTYWGGWNIPYYGLVLSVFAVFGILAIGELLKLIRLDRLLKKCAFGSKAVAALLIAASVLVSGLCALNNSPNAYLMGTPREEMPQYRFAKIINEVENPTLLNHGFLDGGFYFAADVVPDCYFFCRLNVVAPGMFDIPRYYMNEADADFVVTRDKKLEEYPNIDTYLFDCVDQATLYFEGKTRTYYLYRLKTLAP